MNIQLGYRRKCKPTTLRGGTLLLLKVFTACEGSVSFVFKFLNKAGENSILYPILAFL